MGGFRVERFGQSTRVSSTGLHCVALGRPWTCRARSASVTVPTSRRLFRGLQNRWSRRDLRSESGWNNVRTYINVVRIVPENISITELRQRLFQLADRVIETGEPVLIDRRGVRLRLVREDAVEERGGRLARLKRRKQSVVVGAPLDPHESPAQWLPGLPKVAETPAPGWPVEAKAGKRRKRR